MNGCTTDYYKGIYVKIDIFVDNVRLNPMCPNTFRRTHKIIVNFKNQLSKNGDKFIKFVGLTNGGNLIAQIRTFDNGEIKIDTAAYSKFIKARQSTYDYCKSKGYKILSPYLGALEKTLVNFHCGHKSNWIIPHNLKKDTECPICKESKGEKSVRLYLENKNIEFIQEYRFKECRCERSLPFDFYIPDYNLCIEFDREQHFKMKFGFDDKEFKLTQIRDKIKNKFCEENNINLLRIPYWELENIEKILDEEFERLIKVS